MNLKERELKLDYLRKEWLKAKKDGRDDDCKIIGIRAKILKMGKADSDTFSQAVDIFLN